MTSTRTVLTAWLVLTQVLWHPPNAQAKKPDDESPRKAQKHGKPAQDRQQQQMRQQHADRQQPANVPSVQIAIGGYFQERQIEAARSYYGRPENAGFCPPGLAKKGTGCLPPGQAKKWRIGTPLPAGVIYYDVPRSVVVTLGVPPSGYKYVRVASDILLIALGTSMVIDAMEDLVRWTFGVRREVPSRVSITAQVENWNTQAEVTDNGALWLSVATAFMAIQWFPGHMHLTRKAIGERIKDIDVVIEMLDARLPGSSANPMLAELIQGKPGLKILSKQDLADPVQTAAWLVHYNALPDVRALALDTSLVSPTKALIDACQQLAPHRGGMVKPMRVLICGIPNVGKSTLINTLKGKRAAKTGDEAGVTKLEQRITLADDFYLYDTPGVLWPRIIVEQSGYNLAASGAIGVNAFDEEVVALELLNYLIPNYPQTLTARYKIQDVAKHTDESMLEAIARQRGAIQSGGRVNTTKAAELVIHDFRSAALGRVTLETPEEFAQWLAEGKKADAERALRKEGTKKAKKQARA